MVGSSEAQAIALQMDDDGEFVNDVEISVQTSPGATFYIPTQDLHENARYSWRVQSSDDEGANSAWSAAQNFWVNAIKEPPKLFEILAPANNLIADNDTVLIQWQATADPDPFDSLRYVVEWSANRDFLPSNPQSYNATITKIAFVRPSGVDSVFWRLFLF